MPLPVPDLAFSASREVWRDKSAIALRLVERVRGPRASAATSSSCASTPSGSAACASGRTAGCAGRASGTARAHAAHSRVSGRRRQRQLKKKNSAQQRGRQATLIFATRLMRGIHSSRSLSCGDCENTSTRGLFAKLFGLAAIWSGKIPRNTGKSPVRSCRARNRSRIAAWPLVRL